MKVIKVIVDELPEIMCHDCRFLEAHNFMGTGRIFYSCELVDDKSFEDKFARPDWCPLVTKEQALDWAVHEIGIEQEKYINFVEGSNR